MVCLFLSHSNPRIGASRAYSIVMMNLTRDHSKRPYMTNHQSSLVWVDHVQHASIYYYNAHQRTAKVHAHPQWKPASNIGDRYYGMVWYGMVWYDSSVPSHEQDNTNGIHKSSDNKIGHWKIVVLVSVSQSVKKIRVIIIRFEWEENMVDGHNILQTTIDVFEHWRAEPILSDNWHQLI